MLGAFVCALRAAYSPERFDQMMRVYLERRRTDYTLAEDLPTRFHKVIEASEMEGWTDELISASLDANPRNSELLKFVRALGLDPVPPNEAPNLEKVVTERSCFIAGGCGRRPRY
jgi:hypothetical protein